MLEHERIAVLAYCGVDCTRELKAWLSSLRGGDINDVDAHAVLSSAPQQRLKRAVAFIREHFQFEVLSERGAAVATAVIDELYRQLDWCDDTWTLDNQHWLADFLRDVRGRAK